MKQLGLLVGVVILLSGCTEPTAFVREPHARLALADAGWTLAADMLEPRFAEAAVAGEDGRIYSFTGFGNGTLSSAERFDPVTGAWSPIAPPEGRWMLGAAQGSDGRIYLVGGMDESGVARSSVQAYDRVTNTWTAGPELNAPRYTHAVTAGADGRIYALGGTETGPSVASVEVLDPALNRWQVVAPMRVERQAHAAATGRDGRIYVFGGITPTGTTAESEVYDPETNTWSDIASMPAPLDGHSAARGGDGRIYVLGGFHDFTAQKSGFAYDPVTDTWSSVPDMNVPRYFAAAAGGLDGYVYVMGGFTDEGIITASAERYLTALPNLPPVARAGGAQRAECVAGVADVTLDGSASSDPDGDPLTYEWLENGQVVAAGQRPTLRLARGVHTLTLRVRDDKLASDDEDVIITVSDTAPPVIAYNQLVSELRPPNHSMALAALVSATDVCDGTAALSFTITSNEAAGDQADWEVRPAGSHYEVWLRSERDGGGSGRVYIIAVTAKDLSANRGYAGGTVLVRRSGSRTAGESPE